MKDGKHLESIESLRKSKINIAVTNEFTKKDKCQCKQHLMILKEKSEN